MSNVNLGELVRGLVIYLDTGTLKVSGGVETNVRSVDGDDRLADGDRPFLLLKREADNKWLCVALFGADGKDRVRLDQKLKTGSGTTWARESWYSCYQFWRIPGAALVKASSPELSKQSNRNYYARNHLSAIDDIAAHKGDSDTEFTPISEL